MFKHVRAPRVVLTALAAAWFAVPVRTAQVDVPGLLAKSREAMGGDALLAGITTLTVTGSHMEDMGPVRLESAVEFFYERPDKFVRRGARSFATGPNTTGRMTLRDGFNGDGLISERHTPNMGVNPTLQIGNDRPTQSAEARRIQAVLSQKRDFVRLMLPLFAASPAAHPLTFRYVSEGTIPGDKGSAPINVHIIEARDATNVVHLLHIETTSHLPVMMSWQARPPVVYSQSTYVTTRGGVSTPAGVPPAMAPIPSGQAPPGGVAITSPNAPKDPAAGMANIEYRLSLTDYKMQDGVRWPHRLITRVGDKVSGDLRLGRFNLNRTVKASTFDITR